MEFPLYLRPKSNFDWTFAEVIKNLLIWNEKLEWEPPSVIMIKPLPLDVFECSYQDKVQAICKDRLDYLLVACELLED